MIHSVIISPRVQHSADWELKSWLERSGHRVEIVPPLEKLPKSARLAINRHYGMDYDDSDLDWLSSSGVKTLNSVEGQRVCRDKLLTLQKATSLGIACGKFYSIENFLKFRHRGKWALKTLRGMQGRGVELGLHASAIASKFQMRSDLRYMAQEEFTGDEYRIQILGEELLCFKKENGGNLAQGAGFKKAEAPKELVGAANKLFASLGISFGAADFIISPEGPRLLDCNVYPGLKSLGQYPDKICRFLRSLLSD